MDRVGLRRQHVDDSEERIRVDAIGLTHLIDTLIAEA